MKHKANTVRFLLFLQICHHVRTIFFVLSHEENMYSRSKTICRFNEKLFMFKKKKKSRKTLPWPTHHCNWISLFSFLFKICVRPKSLFRSAKSELWKKVEEWDDCWYFMLAYALNRHSFFFVQMSTLSLLLLCEWKWIFGISTISFIHLWSVNADDENFYCIAFLLLNRDNHAGIPSIFRSIFSLSG